MIILSLQHIPKARTRTPGSITKCY